MADIIIVAVIAIAVFFVVRRELRKLRRGQCAGGCSGCSGACSGGARASEEKTER